jgi:aldehyde dehydrogenase (NAD+)
MAPLQLVSKLIINNQETPCLSGKQIACVSPSTGEEWFQVDEGDVEDVEVAIKYAEAAWPAWSELPAHQRGATIRKLAALIQEHSQELAEFEAKTMGNPISSVQAYDIAATVAILNYNASLCETANSTVSTNTPGMLNYILHQPYGVTAAIIPWNIPMIAFAFKVGASVAAGNAIILKSSEKAPVTPLLLGKLAIEAGFPPGIIQIISGYGPTAGAALARHMKVRKISFTGSLAVGKKVQEMAAQTNLKRVTLELGGKSPAIVFPDADLDAAAKALAFSITAWTGQACMASTRVYVHSSIFDNFSKVYVAAIQAITNQPGIAMDAKTNLGPLVDKIQHEKVLKYLETGKTEATILMGGKDVSDRTGFYVDPTVFTGASDDSIISRQEIFGPVSVLNKFDTEEEVIQRANDTQYGLYASVFTRDLSRAVRCTKALDAGSVAINCASPTITPDMPFGGYKQSGIGREIGPNCLSNWQETKAVYMKID